MAKVIDLAGEGGGSGTGTGWAGEVNTFADLPLASASTGLVYLVKTSTGLMITFNLKRSGFYQSDGATWTKISQVQQMFTDDELTFQDDADNTKQLGFELSGITTATRRIATFPDKDGTIAMTSDIAVPGNHVAATTLNTWVLDSGDIYYQDFLHNLGSDDVAHEIYDSVTKESVLVEKVDRTSTNNIRVYIQGNTASLRVIVFDAIYGYQGTSGRTVVSNPATPYTAQNNDVILWDCTAGSKTVNLPASASSNHFRIDIKKTDASGNTIVIDGNASELIEGSLTVELLNEGDAVTLVCDGAGWYILASV